MTDKQRGRVEGVAWAVIAWLIIILFVFALRGQTQVDLNQLKNVTVSPIASIERSKCVGSGPGWNCAGLELMRITLVDGAILGPWVLVPAAPEVVSSQNWISIPLKGDAK